MSLDPIGVALRVAEVLDALEIEYLVGGSVAASLTGISRTTLDVDMVVCLEEGRVDALVDRLGEDFHADPESLRRAVRTQSSSNLIHFESGMKVDLFVARDQQVDREQMRRRRRLRVATNPDRFLFVSAPEDTIVQKLRWYRMGDEASDRQWGDILGVLRINRGELDMDYLLTAAEWLGVSDLLERALHGTDESLR
jgi:hypothetical protein